MPAQRNAGTPSFDAMYEREDAGCEGLILKPTAARHWIRLSPPSESSNVEPRSENAMQSWRELGKWNCHVSPSSKSTAKQ
jgi:hypothetical protein